jgi:hypothetical protein
LTLFETPFDEINFCAYLEIDICFNDFANAIKSFLAAFSYEQLTLFEMENDEYKK